MALSDESTPDWELYKENAAPLERGRNIQKLSNALAPKTSAVKAQRKEDDKNIHGYERLVRSSEKFGKLYADNQSQGDNEIQDMLSKCKVDKDPIVHWLRYIKYHEESYPSNTHAQFLLKERCAMSLLHHPKYTNDVRFIRVCVLYADSVDDPHGQFKLFHKHKIGSEVAIFWLAWAWVAEKKNDFQFAEKIFRKAIQKKAQPEKVVNQRYKQFQRRMSRYWLNANNPDNDDGEVDSDQQNKRGTLSGLTEEGVRQNHRGVGVNAIARSHPRRNGHGQSNVNPGGKTNGVSRPDGAVGFEVFTDDNVQGDGGYDLNQYVTHADENVPLPRMVRQNDRTKENAIEAEAWNERGGLGSQYKNTNDNDDRWMQGASSVVSRWAGTGGDTITAGGTSSQPAFQVFVDEECADSEEAANPVNHQKMSERSIGLRERLDDRRGPSLAARSSLTTHFEGSTRSKLPLKSKQIRTTKGILNDKSSRTKRSTVPLGFDKKMIPKQRNNEEFCFEEHRAKARRFKSVPSTLNFNLLHKMDDPSSMSPNSSCMEIDDTSTIEEVEMEDMSRSISMIREEEQKTKRCEEKEQLTISKSEAQRSDTKKVLFGANTSIGNYSSSRVHNISTASSTVDERDAVGVVGDREETLNTKFAARELSMMFSSPAGFMNQSTAVSSKKNSEKMLFSIHNDEESYASRDRPAQRVSSSLKSGDGAFAIFCDEGRNEDGNFPASKTAPKKRGFAIYEESESEDDSFEDDDRNGDTASLADIMEIMKPTSPDKQQPLEHKKCLKTASGGFSIFCEDSPARDRGIDNGTVLTEDTATFGDLSFIPSSADGDTCNLQNKMNAMALS